LIFSEFTLAQLEQRYPNLLASEIRNVAARVSLKHSSEPLHDPAAYLDRALRSMSDRAPRLRAHPEANVSPSRGSLALDGSWDSRFAAESETESAIRQFVATVTRARLSPAESADIVTSVPALTNAFRAGTVTAMLVLDASPKPVQFNLQFPASEWLFAAWACLQTSTSAEEFAMRSILRTLAPTA